VMQRSPTRGDTDGTGSGTGRPCCELHARIISQAGKRLTDFPIETNGHALVEAIRRIPGRKHRVFDEGDGLRAHRARGARGARFPALPATAPDLPKTSN
jgi:hypothetical protein